MTTEFLIADEAYFRADLDFYEKRWRIDSARFYELHCAEEDPEEIEPIDALIWITSFEGWKEQREITRRREARGAKSGSARPRR